MKVCNAGLQKHLLFGFWYSSGRQYIVTTLLCQGRQFWVCAEAPSGNLAREFRQLQSYAAAE